MAKKLDKLSSTLGSVLKSHGLQGSLGEYRIQVQWDKTVGALIARHARPRSVRGKKLYLSVDSPAWMQQLSLLKPQLIEKLNGALGKGMIKDIMLTLGEVDPPERAEEEAPAPMPLSAEERERIEQYVGDIPDPELRDAMRRVIEKDFQSKKALPGGERNRDR
jgi:hypothetical protein